MPPFRRLAAYCLLITVGIAEARAQGFPEPHPDGPAPSLAPNLVWDLGHGHQFRLNLSGPITPAEPSVIAAEFQPPAMENSTDQFCISMEERRATAEYRFHPNGGSDRFHLFLAAGLEDFQANLEEDYDPAMAHKPALLPNPILAPFEGVRLVQVAGLGYNVTPNLEATLSLAVMRIQGRPFRSVGLRISYSF